MTVSIIIAVKTWQKNLEECVANCLKLDYPDFEVIILPDNAFQVPGGVPVRVIPTGVVNPAKKRDMAIDAAKGEVLAFLDDDALPQRDWLKNAVLNFDDPKVAAVGGPAVTPENDSLMQKASGRVYSSFLVSANYIYRYIPGKRQYVEDYPSCNFLVRKSVMKELCGFSTDFWPGEDTKLCLDITKKLGKKIVYDPSVLVYHHRRPLFKGHLNQVANYALHRGYFAKVYPETSLKIAYFVPSLFVVFLFFGASASLLSPLLRKAYFICLLSYLAVILLCSASRDLRLTLLVALGTLATHFTYGVYFMKGLLSRRLKEEG